MLLFIVLVVVIFILCFLVMFASAFALGGDVVLLTAPRACLQATDSLPSLWSDLYIYIYVDVYIDICVGLSFSVCVFLRARRWRGSPHRDACLSSGNRLATVAPELVARQATVHRAVQS